MQGFWKNLPKPFFALAPLANVTDAAFRAVIAKYGKPHVMFTEFVSADGLFMGGMEKLMFDLLFGAKERPIVAQFFTARPENMEKAAMLARELGFDGIDINMGCPDRSIERQGAGAAHMKNPKLAREIIRAAKKGALDLPVSIKTRIGYNKDELESWLPELLAAEPAAITLHARTRKEMSKVPAHWNRVKDAVKIRDSLKSKTLIVGNGDTFNIVDARMRATESGADGIMLGRAIFGNPWMFREYAPSLGEKLEVLVEHTELFEQLLGSVKNFAIMKKHYKAYVNGWEGAKELRVKLMGAASAREVQMTVEKYLEDGNVHGRMKNNP